MDEKLVEIAVDGMASAEEWSSFWSEEDARKLARAALSALEAAGYEIRKREPLDEADAPTMRLKPLVWEYEPQETGMVGYQRTTTPFGSYEVWWHPDDNVWYLDGTTVGELEFETEAEAKAAAEADYQRRAMEMWETIS